MKTYYAIHSDKTHVKVKSLTDFNTQFREKSEWGFVQADSEGWIEHTGKECPLPDRVMCDAVMEAGSVIEGMYSYKFNWRSVVKYRPILKAFEKWDENHITRPPEKVQEPDPAANLTANTVDLLGTLIRAHEHAQQIPDLEAELREVLAGMGYDLVARSPFVEPAPAVEPDMTDWRNWREGDWVECVDAFGWAGLFLVGALYLVEKIKPDGLVVDGKEVGRHVADFRFHSRPAKENESNKPQRTNQP